VHDHSLVFLGQVEREIEQGAEIGAEIGAEREVAEASGQGFGNQGFGNGGFNRGGAYGEPFK